MNSIEIKTRRAALLTIQRIYIEEFSDIPGGLMAPLYAGLKELVKLGLYERARTLINSVTTPPPTITEARMNEVKALLLATIPQD